MPQPKNAPSLSTPAILRTGAGSPASNCRVDPEPANPGRLVAQRSRLSSDILRRSAGRTASQAGSDHRFHGLHSPQRGLQVRLVASSLAPSCSPGQRGASQMLSMTERRRLIQRRRCSRRQARVRLATVVSPCRPAKQGWVMKRVASCIDGLLTVNALEQVGVHCGRKYQSKYSLSR
jgi:hypothetical protein